MDLLEASERRIPLAVEVWSGNVRLPVEIVRLNNGRIAWSEYVWLIDSLYCGNALHVIDDEPTGNGPEWRAGRLRFFEIDRVDDELMFYWRACESERQRKVPEAVQARALEIAESECSPS